MSWTSTVELTSLRVLPPPIDISNILISTNENVLEDLPREDSEDSEESEHSSTYFVQISERSSNYPHGYNIEPESHSSMEEESVVSCSACMVNGYCPKEHVNRCVTPPTCPFSSSLPDKAPKQKDEALERCLLSPLQLDMQEDREIRQRIEEIDYQLPDIFHVLDQQVPDESQQQPEGQHQQAQPQLQQQTPLQQRKRQAALVHQQQRRKTPLEHQEQAQLQRSQQAKEYKQLQQRVKQLKQQVERQLGRQLELHKQYKQQAQQASADMMTNESLRSEESSTSSSSESEDDIGIAEDSIIQPDRSDVNEDRVASVLTTPPSEPADNIRLSDSSASLDSATKFYEVNRLGEEGNISTCEQITRRKFSHFCLNDHSYYQNQPHNLECLGIQTPSESEEDEIDVVTCRTVRQRRSPSNVPQCPNQRTQQLTARAARSTSPPARRPRGRPPTNPNRKRSAQTYQSEQQPAAKRSCQRRHRSRTRRHSPDEEDRRNQHNDMERNRRVALRIRFEHLKELVPTIAGRHKAPKVMVLTEACKYCNQLTEQEKLLDKLLNRRKELDAKLKALLEKVPEQHRSTILSR